ncbi:membrane protein [Alicyclobacillus contaminans]|uniref:YitT family protein n=1 Tax=Alicyclobacillus contaminans TaxID=392016 RepID=UPI00041626F5|nr:YitT family protein [Alicyclobacillus contaminans]GMA51575.1 membrane protein [Alicyclobacillus contaminans]
MDTRSARSKLSVDYWMAPTGHPLWTFFVRIAIILIGCFVGAVSVNSFLVPAHILAGGITGFAQMITHFTHWPLGTLYFAFNIPLFILGWRDLGKRFILLTGIGILGFSLFTDVVHIHFNLPSDPLLVALYGGVLGGVSSGLILRVGGSAGGTDILSLALNRRTGKSVGSVSFAINVVIVLLSMTVFGVAAGLYTLVSMYATSRVMNALMHYQNRKTAMIVSTKADAIAEAIGRHLNRGCTFIEGSGGYTRSPLGVLMCALTSIEVGELKALCSAVDPKAFVIILDTTEVYGHFRNLTS